MKAEGFAERLRTAMARQKVTNAELAREVGVNPVTVSNWRSGKYLPEGRLLSEIASALSEGGPKVSVEWLLNGDAKATPAADFKPGWPEGWQARTYRLALEASEKGATEEEIVIVRGWMMDPQLQLLWSGGAPADDRMKELDGIEIGARTWLRARGRMVKQR